MAWRPVPGGYHPGFPYFPHQSTVQHVLDSDKGVSRAFHTHHLFPLPVSKFFSAKNRLVSLPLCTTVLHRTTVASAPHREKLLQTNQARNQDVCRTYTLGKHGTVAESSRRYTLRCSQNNYHTERFLQSTKRYDLAKTTHLQKTKLFFRRVEHNEGSTQ